MAEIFISHSSKDIGFAQQIAALLRAGGFGSLFLDFDPDDGLQAASRWEQVLYSRLSQARAVIVVHSANWKASRWCFAEVTHAKLLKRAILPVFVDASPPDPVLSEYQGVFFLQGADAASRIDSGLRQAGVDPLPRWDAARPPFPGFEAFHANDAAIYFGRTDEIARVVDHLALVRRVGSCRFLIITGSSGSGKSSLMRAGVTRRLEADRSSWRMLPTLRPSRMSLGAGSLDEAMESGHALAADPAGREVTVVLPLDQLEEVFTHFPKTEHASFFQRIAQWLDAQDSRIVLATMRTDALTELELAARTASVTTESIAISAMSKKSMLLAIERPAEIGGVDLEDGLSQMIVDDVGDSRALPLMAYTLREMYERTRHPRKFTVTLYRDQLGGIEGSVGRTIDAALAGAQATELWSGISRLFSRLVQLNDTEEFVRRRISIDELPEDLRQLVDRLVTARVLVMDSANGNRTVEVAHEALFKQWKTLKDWLEAHLPYFEWNRRFMYALSEWRKNHSILSFEMLQELESWQRLDLVESSPAILQLIDASRRETRWIRWMRAATGALRAGLALSIFWVLATTFVDQKLASAMPLPKVDVEWSPSYVHLLILLALHGLIGAFAASVGFEGRKAYSAQSGAAVFLVLTVFAGFTAGLRFPIASSWWTTPVQLAPMALAFASACLLVYRQLNKALTLPWLIQAAGLTVLTVSFFKDSDRSIPYLDSGSGSIEFLTEGAIEFARSMNVPAAAIAFGLFVSGAVTGGLRGKRPLDATLTSEPSKSAPVAWGHGWLPLVIGLGAVVSALAMWIFADWGARRAYALSQAEMVARSLVAWQSDYRTTKGEFAPSLDALLSENQLQDKIATENCASNAGKTNPGEKKPVHQHTYVLPIKWAQANANVHVVQSDRQGWAARVSSPAAPRLSCRVWDSVGTEFTLRDSPQDYSRWAHQVACDFNPDTDTAQTDIQELTGKFDTAFKCGHASIDCGLEFENGKIVSREGCGNFESSGQ
jgi:hypothetical protein